MTEIYRLKGPKQSWDFGAKQAAMQLLDNYPPHIQEQCSISQLTHSQIQTELDQLARMCTETKSARMLEWAESRVEFYSKAIESAWKDDTPAVRLD